MKKILLSFTLGAALGVVAYTKMQKSKLPQKALDTAQEKLNNM